MPSVSYLRFWLTYRLIAGLCSIATQHYITHLDYVDQSVFGIMELEASEPNTPHPQALQQNQLTPESSAPQSMAPIVSILGLSSDNSWPLRLLHIPTMTSLRRRDCNPGEQLGSWYGKHYKPKYCAMSYTWGNFKLEENEEPTIGSINITGIDWPVPRISPSHFTVHGFQRVIRKIREYDHEFLWLDVACINQNPNSPEKQSEIGRQAAIFQKAEKTYIWLTKLPGKDWQKMMDRKDNLWELDLDRGDPPGVSTQIDICLKNILENPWFKSLWTLQEAYLSKSAHVLDSAGSVMTGGSAPTSFGTLVDWCWSQWVAAKTPHRLLDVSGLPAIHDENPFLVYVATRHRKATNELDYIYGIEQIFGFRLGNTAEASEKQQYSLLELEEQFGTEMLKKYPVQSQLHIFSRQPNSGEGWHVNQLSDIPRLETEFKTLTLKNSQTALCNLCSSSKGSQVMGYFSGDTCTAHDFFRACEEDRDIRLFVGVDSRESLNNDKVGSDLKDLLQQLNRHHVARIHLHTDWEEHWIADAELPCTGLKRLRRHNIIVLRLGKCVTNTDEDSTEFSGLILTKTLERWQRLGICIWRRAWNLSPPIEKMRFFQSIEWKKESGHFS